MITPETTPHSIPTNPATAPVPRSNGMTISSCAQAAGLVLGPLFFAPIAKNSPALAQILWFATIGISFLFRPLGAIICGHLGDKLGRKVVLVMTLILMGASTVLIGVLPTYQQIGLWAPVLLIVLRIIQGFSAGGEWGGAALMAVEHAPVDRRSFLAPSRKLAFRLASSSLRSCYWRLLLHSVKKHSPIGLGAYHSCSRSF